MAPTWHPDGSPPPFAKEWRPLWTIFWLPLGTPKSTKNVFFLKNEGPAAVIRSIFVGKTASTNIFIDLFSTFELKIVVFFVDFF